MDTKVIKDLQKKATEWVKKQTKLTGEKWVRATLPLIVDINKTIKAIKEEKEQETGATKLILDGMSKPYNDALKELSTVDEQLREEILLQYTEKESIAEPGIGEIVFPARWGFTVENVKKVPVDFLTVDQVKVNQEIKKGVRRIPGIVIEEKRSVTVRTQTE